MPAGTRVLAVLTAALALSAGCVESADPPPDPTSTSVRPPPSGGTGSAVPDTDPYDTVRGVYRGVATNAPDEVCSRFTPEAARQFAGAFEAESCTTVVILLYHGRVADPQAYANTSLGSFTADDGQTSAEIDSCEFEVRGGPRLGVFVLTADESGTWLITGHRMPSCDG
jgi:hypothetical protein